MGTQDTMGPSQSLWQNRRIQRSGAFALIVLMLLVFVLYSGGQWPSSTGTVIDRVQDRIKHPVSSSAGKTNIPSDSRPTKVDEPLYNTDIPEYDPNNMPVIPSTPDSTSKPVEATTSADSTKKPIESSASGLDPKRVALLIETRPNPAIPALLTQFINILPPAWTIRFVGSRDAFSLVEASYSLVKHIKSRKLVMTELPDEYPVNSNELLSQTLTNLKFYSEFLAPAEWLLVFQTDSMICSASEQSLDDWVDKGYSWVGAPWHLDRTGGNGGLSLRHVPSIITLLKNETRAPGDLWEDRWLCDRLKNNALGLVAQTFSVESIYYERPFGYHLRGSGKLVDAAIWGNKTRKRQIFKYCPEVKIVLGNMNLEPADEAAQEKLENDAKGSAVVEVFKAVVTKVMEPDPQPTTNAVAP